MDINESKSKVDPSFKSKRYRDKLRTEIKSLETLLPVDRTALSRKLDSQTVFRLVISYFRSKIFFKAGGLCDKEGDDVGDVEDETEDSPLIDDTLRDAVHDINVNQLLDGFLLVITSDGTVVYVSESILQYLGFNQVDLMHRCIYGVVHPDDHSEVKVILEHTLGPLQLKQTTSGESEDKDEDSQEEPETCKPVSFLCRMKCFSGTSAGYLKMHCSGKICHLSELSKSNRTSCQVMFLFCHPFMLSTTDMDQEAKQNVFWSKHDLDLSVRELDKKALSVLGYHSAEIEGRSFYSLVHPEDVATCAACHKTLAESNEVQTLYFRLESKDGDWVWVQSRGKVICKNSKKFSIVFSHCPVREEDSTYIQQETVLRHRYAINDLMCMTQITQCGVAWKESPHCLAVETSPAKRLSPLSFSSSAQDDAFLAMHSLSLSPCPSSWHALSDRHSPILPSSHVAHKISQREKQAQFQEFKRKQQAQYEQTTFMHEQWEDQASVLYSGRGYVNPIEPQDFSRWYPEEARTGQGRQMMGRFCPPGDVFQRNMYPQYPPEAYNPYFPVYNQEVQTPSSFHNMPPSPPPSPPQYHQNNHRYVPYSVRSPDHLLQPCRKRMRDDTDTARADHLPPYHRQHFFATPCIRDLQRTAEKYLSPWNQEVEQTREFKPLLQLSSANVSNQSRCAKQTFKRVPTSSQSCAYAATYRAQSPELSQSHVRTEGHMAIVEQGQQLPARGFMDLPSIGSFLEYLNDV